MRKRVSHHVPFSRLDSGVNVLVNESDSHLADVGIPGFCAFPVLCPFPKQWGHAVLLCQECKEWLGNSPDRHFTVLNS